MFATKLVPLVSPATAAHRPLRVILMCLGMAEINEDAVAHVFGNEAVEATHSFGDAFLGGGLRDGAFRLAGCREGREFVAQQRRLHSPQFRAIKGRTTPSQRARKWRRFDPALTEPHSNTNRNEIG